MDLDGDAAGWGSLVGVEVAGLDLEVLAGLREAGGVVGVDEGLVLNHGVGVCSEVD